MYNCELAKHVPELGDRKPHTVPAGTPAIKVVVATRPTEYPSRPKANKLRIGRRMKHFDDPGGAGYEIAKEVLACRQCALDYAALEADRADQEGFVGWTPPRSSLPEAPRT